MEKAIKILSFVVMTGFLTSCLTSGVEITVNKDGSGELVQTFHVMREYMAFMNLGEAGTDPNLINMEQLRNQADQMGEGVIFERVEPSPEDSPYAGYKAYYRFTDISKIKTSPTPMTTPGETTTSDSDWISFDFRKGGTATLTILSSSDGDSDDDYSGSDDEEWDSEPPSQEEQAQIEQMKQIYSSMHFWFKVKVNGSITDTNALYADNSEVIIMDMPFERIIENDKLFIKLTSDQESDLDKLRRELEKSGVKIDDREKIEISFR